MENPLFPGVSPAPKHGPQKAVFKIAPVSIEFTLSRKDPAYVGRAKEIQKAQKAVEEGTCPLDVV